MPTEEMRGIPFDSKLQTAEDGSMYEDREIFSADIAEYFGYLSTNGVCIREGESLNNQLKITAGTAGVVVFNPGAIKIQGRMGWMEEAVEKQTEAGGTKPRYDTAVIELNLSSSERRFIPKIIKGVEADSPVPPTLTQTENIYQLGLANIYRAANSTALGTITDTRNDSQRCGISKVAVPNVPDDVINLWASQYPGVVSLADILTKISTEGLPIPFGGTGATTAMAALENLGLDSIGKFYEQHFDATAIPVNTSKAIASLTLPAGTYVVEGSSSWNVDNRNLYIMTFIRDVTADREIAMNRGVMIAGGGLTPTAVAKFDVESTITMYAYWGGGSGNARHNSGYLRAVRVK